jgi:hypothetical protein
MDSLNQVEIQNIRHIAGKCCNYKKRIEYYKTLTQDQQVTEAFDSFYTELSNLENELCEMF